MMNRAGTNSDAYTSFQVSGTNPAIIVTAALNSSTGNVSSIALSSRAHRRHRISVQAAEERHDRSGDMGHSRAFRHRHHHDQLLRDGRSPEQRSALQQRQSDQSLLHCQLRLDLRQRKSAHGHAYQRDLERHGRLWRRAVGRRRCTACLYRHRDLLRQQHERQRSPSAIASAPAQ